MAFATIGSRDGPRDGERTRKENRWASPQGSLQPTTSRRWMREVPVSVSRRGGAFRRMNSRVSPLIAGWRTGLSRPVLILQAGNALNYFGYGLILPFEIIYGGLLEVW